MGCTASKPGPQSTSRADLMAWYKGDLKRAGLFTNSDDPRVHICGKKDHPFTDLRELQYLSQAVDFETFKLSSDANLHRWNSAKLQHPQAAFAEFAKHAHHLKHLHMASIAMPSSCFVALFLNLASPTTLEEVTLEDCNIDDAVVDAIAAAGLANLKKLTIQRAGTKPMNWVKLVSSLPALASLSVVETSFDGPGLRAAGANKNLEHLKLSKCVQLLESDYAAIPEHCWGLKTLNVAGCNLEASFFHGMVAHHMQKLSHLELGTLEIETPQQQKAAKEALDGFIEMVGHYTVGEEGHLDLTMDRDGYYFRAHTKLMQRLEVAKFGAFGIGRKQG